MEQLIVLRAEVEALHVTTGIIASKHGVTPEHYLSYRKAAFEKAYAQATAGVLETLRDGSPPQPPDRR
jgi:hypothetical protein